MYFVVDFEARLKFPFTQEKRRWEAEPPTWGEYRTHAFVEGGHIVASFGIRWCC